MTNTHSIASKRAGSRTVASALRDNVHEIACALEPLLFPDGIPEELDIPVLLRALADLLERDAGTSGGRRADGRDADSRKSDPGDGPTSQKIAQGTVPPPSAGAPASPSGWQSHSREESQINRPTDAPTAPPAGQSAGQPATESAPDLSNDPAGAPAGECASESDDPRQALRHALLRMRSLLGTMCGPHTPRRYGLDSRVPEEPEQLLAYARRAAHLLERADPSASRPAPFVTLDLVGAAASLREHIDALEAQLYPEPAEVDMNSDVRLRERTRPRWSPDVQAAASVAEGLLRLAQMDERADLVRALRSARVGRRGVSQRGPESRSAVGIEPPPAA